MSVSVCAFIEGDLAQDVMVTITTQSITAQGVFFVYVNVPVCIICVNDERSIQCA